MIVTVLRHGDGVCRGIVAADAVQANGILVTGSAAPEAVVASTADMYGAHCLTVLVGDAESEAAVAVWCLAWNAVIGGVCVGQCKCCVVLKVLLEKPFWLHHVWATFDVMSTVFV